MTLAQQPPATSPIGEEEVAAYVEEGFLVCEGLIAPDELAELKDDLMAFARGGYPCDDLPPVGDDVDDAAALARVLCIHQPHNLSPVIRRFVDHPAIAEVLSKVVTAHLPAGWWDGSVKCMQSMYFAKGPGKPGQAWHQDEVYIPTRDRSLAGAWIAIDDATVDNGCLWVLPGSHRPGVLHPQRDHGRDEFDMAQESYGFDDSAEIPVEVPAGSVVFFNGYLLHRSKPNRTTGSYRRVLVNHYMSAASLLPWVGTDGHGPVAKADVRRVVMVAGEDPHAWKGYEAGKKSHLRAEKAARERP